MRKSISGSLWETEGVFCRSCPLPGGSDHRHGCWRQTPFHGRHLVGQLA